MSGNCLLGRLFQLRQFHLFIQAKQKWNVVDRASRIGGTLHKDTILGLGQRVSILYLKSFPFSPIPKKFLQLFHRIIFL